MENAVTEEVVSASDISKRLGVRLRVVVKWYNRGIMPPPDYEPDPPRWRWATVEAWAQKTDRLP